MPDDLYERDILVWSEKQASLLRRLARGEGVNEAIDWDHVIEEVEDVGASELHGCQSQLSQALLHLLKLAAEPGSQAAAHWTSEVIGFLAGARRRFSPGMRQRLELDELYDTGAVPQVNVFIPYAVDFNPKLAKVRRDISGFVPVREFTEQRSEYLMRARARIEVPDARLPEACPYSIDDLLALKPDPETLVEKLRPSSTV